MRSGLSFLQTIAGFTLTGAALLACGDDAAGTGGGGGASAGTEASSTTGSPASGPGSVTSGSSTVAGPGPGPGPGSGGGSCEAVIFADEALNSCGQEFCCDLMAVCDPNLGGDDALCFNAEGQFDETLSGAAPLADCLDENACFGEFAQWCDSGIGYQDPDEEAQAHAECISDNCCDPLAECTADGADVQGCLDCLNGKQANFDQCIGVSDCSATLCDRPLISIPICDTGLSFPDPEVGTCLSDNCCDEFSDCVGDGSEADIQACIDCFAEEPLGALCAPADACQTTNCNTAICDSGLTVGNIELAACLTEFCCEEHTTCMGDGSEEDAQACIDCFAMDPPGALCADAVACQDLNCAGGEGGGGGAGGGV